jgi:hypothetical protein
MYCMSLQHKFMPSNSYVPIHEFYKLRQNLIKTITIFPFFAGDSMNYHHFDVEVSMWVLIVYQFHHFNYFCIDLMLLQFLFFELFIYFCYLKSIIVWFHLPCLFLKSSFAGKY